MLQFNGDWRELADGQRVELWKFVNNEWRCVDYGLKKFTDKYLAKGFIVKPITKEN